MQSLQRRVWNIPQWGPWPASSPPGSTGALSTHWAAGGSAIPIMGVESRADRHSDPGLLDSHPPSSYTVPPMFAEMKLSDFLEKIAAQTPTPGGGSVSAAVRSMGAAPGVTTARY